MGSEYERMTEGNRHFNEERNLLEIIIKVVVFSFIASIGAFILEYGLLHIGLWPLFFLFVMVFVIYYATKKPKQFPMQVSEQMVSTSVKHKITLYQGKAHLEKEKEFNINRIKPFVIDLKEYVHSRSNRNVLITGASGQGKSKLTRYLLGIMEYQKVIFSFKANEEYLKTEYKAVNMKNALPNPFTDTEAFISAFTVAFPISSVGIQASMIPTALEGVLKKSKSWKDFKELLDTSIRGSKDINKRSALLFIQANSKRLSYYDTSEFKIGTETAVLDFSSLNQDAMSFYAELVLRQIYHDMERRARKEILICVDEAHRLTTGHSGRYHTIIVEMSREIRDKGMLWIATQNYSDIPDNIRNQFASQFVFKSTSQNDLTALRAIEPLLAWTVSGLPNHYFVDAQFPSLHKFIPVYYYNPKGEKDAETAQLVENSAKEPLFELKGDRPTATQHAGMLAIYNNPEASLNTLAKYLKQKGWITGPSTIYGNNGRPGIFNSLASSGLVKKVGASYKLTEEGLGWVDPDMILSGVENLGSELHVKLLKKVIAMLHERNTLVVAPKDKASPDLVGYPMSSGRKKYLWDDSKKRAYEVQTTARKENVLANRERDISAGFTITWVTHYKEVLEEIKKLTEDKDEYLLVKV